MRTIYSVSLSSILVMAEWLTPVPVHASDGGIVALTPHPSERLSQAPKTIAFRVTARSVVAKNAVHVFVDGRDVSDALSVTGTTVQYRPDQKLAPGEHAVEASVSDAAGGRLAYTWTFTIDGANAANAAQNIRATASDGTSASSGSGADEAPSGTQPSNDDDAADTPSTVIYGQQNNYGGFYPLSTGPYYWGDRAAFEFVGVPGGYGFLTFAGIPGVFDLLPLGLNTFYAIVPIPIGFVFGQPFVTCHFFTPTGSPNVAVLPSFPVVRHRRLAPPPLRSVAVARTPLAGSTSLRRGAPVRRVSLLWATPARGHRGSTFRSVHRLLPPRVPVLQPAITGMHPMTRVR